MVKSIKRKSQVHHIPDQEGSFHFQILEIVPPLPGQGQQPSNIRLYDQAETF